MGVIEVFLFYLCTRFTSFLTPGIIFKCKVGGGEGAHVVVEKVREIKLNVDLDLKSFEVTQVFYPSKDGAPIPMFIVSHKVVKSKETKVIT